MMATFFVIFLETRRNRWGIPMVWTGRNGWSTFHFMAHQYLTRERAEAAIARNEQLKADGVYYLTVEEFEQKYSVALQGGQR